MVERRAGVGPAGSDLKPPRIGRGRAVRKLPVVLLGLLGFFAVVLFWARITVAQEQPQATQQALTAEESAGDAAVKQGQLREAFQHYMNALENLPARTSLDSDKALREKIIKVVLQLNPPPAIPQDAIRHAAYAQAAIQDAGKNADTSDLNNAVSEIETALRIAPWWPQAYFNLGEVQEKAHQPGKAAEALQLYLPADPQATLAKKNGTNAQDVQMEIYKLQYEAKRESEGVALNGCKLLAGVTVQQVDPDIREQFDIPSSTRGVRVVAVSSSSVAAQADLREGDVIDSVSDGVHSEVTVHDLAELHDALSGEFCNQEVWLHVIRNGKHVSVPVYQ